MRLIIDIPEPLDPEDVQRALEKQNAMKPIIKLGVQSIDFVEYEDGHGEAKPKTEHQYRCPACSGYISRLLIIAGKNVACKKKRYCDRCGQKIDWNETDDQQVTSKLKIRSEADE